MQMYYKQIEKQSSNFQTKGLIATNKNNKKRGPALREKDLVLQLYLFLEEKLDQTKTRLSNGGC